MSSDYQRLQNERKWCSCFRRRNSDVEDEQNDDTMTIVNNMRDFLIKLPSKLNETKRRQQNASLAAKEFLEYEDRSAASRKASLAMRYKRLNERWGQFQSTIENLIITYEEAIMSKTMFNILEKSEEALETLLESMSGENVVVLMNKLNEQMVNVNEISDTLAQPTDCLEYIDRDDIEAELDRLQIELDQEKYHNDDNNSNNNNDSLRTGTLIDTKMSTNTERNKTKKKTKKREKVIG